MSTRAVYTFFGDQGEAHHVYKHSDGYPSGAAQWITAALNFAWKLPRYESDEFAAAFVAANKSYYRERLFELYKKDRKTKGDRDAIKRYESYAHGGGDGGQVRLITPKEARTPAMEAASQFASDIEFRYEIRCQDGQLYVKTFATNFWNDPTETELWSGPLSEMAAWADKFEKSDDDAA